MEDIIKEDVIENEIEQITDEIIEETQEVSSETEQATDEVIEETQVLINETEQISDEEIQEKLSESLEEIKIKDKEPEPPNDRLLAEDEQPVEIKKPKLKTEIPKVDFDVSEAEKLYEEFSSFLETRADIKADEGVKIVIPTGIDILDAHLGGGLAVGAMGIIVGTPGSGKTTLAIQTLANGQRKFKGDLIGSFLDSEEATTSIRLSNLGVNYPKIKPYSDVTVEKVFKFLEGLCLFKEEHKIIDKPSIVVWDSIANTLSQKEREVEDINSVIGYKARLLSILIPKYVAKCAKYGICFLAINQLRDQLQLSKFAPAADLKFMSHTKSMPGGQVLKFGAMQLLEMKVKKAITIEKSPYGFDGIISNIKVVKNKLFAPNINIDICGSFVRGFSNFWTSYIFLAENKRITKTAWPYLVSLPTKKFRVKDAKNLYETDKEFKDEFDKNVKEIIQLEIIDKYSI